MCRNCSRQLALEVRAGSGHRQGGTDPAEELCNFDIFFLRYLRGVKSELPEQAVHISLHQICKGADSGAPSLDSFSPRARTSSASFAASLASVLAFSALAFATSTARASRRAPSAASALLFASAHAAARASSRAAFSFSRLATRSSTHAKSEVRSLSILSWWEAQREATKAFKERSSTS